MRTASSLAAKPPKTDRVHGSQPRASQHGLKRFGNHRHVDDDAIPFRYPFRGHGPGQSRDAAEEFGERDRPFCSGDGAVVDDCGVFAPAGFDVPVQGVPAAIDERIVEPCEKRLFLVEQCSRRRFDPIDRTGCLQPECFRDPSCSSDRLLDNSWRCPFAARLGAHPKLGRLSSTEFHYSHVVNICVQKCLHSLAMMQRESRQADLRSRIIALCPA